ncbi:MAG: Cof-type HAD-IIB family hydrolase [Oscillospiraceae bacterium]|nr:Cof-type HAD-IIB family hydrolase [Oscillospiraceae bacterium]
MRYKLIAFDLDGTFLDDGKNIPEKNLAALAAAAERGVQLVPATGRIMAGIPEQIRALPFIRYYITINGAYVCDTLRDRALYRGEIPLERALEMLRYMETLPVLYDCYQDNMGWMSGCMLDRAPEYFRAEPGMLELVRRLRVRVDSLPEYLRAKGEPVQKLQMYFRRDDMDERARQLRLLPALFPELAATTSVSNNIEINSVTAGKDRGLAALCGELGIDLRDTAAFGDGSNDLKMISAAGLGVAMANGDERLKAAAGLIAPDNNAAGVGETIMRLLEQ